MSKGLFTSTEEIKFQTVYRAPLLGTKKMKKFKPLFTSFEEIKFQALMRGEIDTSPVEHLKTTPREMQQNNKRVAQNIKRINQGQIQAVWRER